MRISSAIAERQRSLEHAFEHLGVQPVRVLVVAGAVIARQQDAPVRSDRFCTMAELGRCRREPQRAEDVAADLSDPDVITALDLANVQPQRLGLATEAERTACLSGLSAVLLRRLAA